MPWMIGPPVMRKLGRNYLVGSIFVVALAIGWAIARRPLGVQREWWARLLPLFLGLLPLFVFMPMTLWFNWRMKREFNAANGRLCTHCAYNVGPLGASGRCPECGEPFDVKTDAGTWRAIGYQVSADRG